MDDPSPYLRYAEALGFQFESPKVAEWGDRVHVRIYFRCVCGQEEGFSMHVHKDMWEHSRVAFDIYREIYYQGAFDYQHLLADGYSDSTIRAMYARVPKDLRYLLPLEFRNAQVNGHQLLPSRDTGLSPLWSYV